MNYRKFYFLLTLQEGARKAAISHKINCLRKSLTTDEILSKNKTEAFQ